MDELKNTISILGDEISDFRERADDILGNVYEKIEEQEKYIEELENCLIDLVHGFTVKEITEFGVSDDDARHIQLLLDEIQAKQEEELARQERAEEQAIDAAWDAGPDLTLPNDELMTPEDQWKELEKTLIPDKKETTDDKDDEGPGTLDDPITEKPDDAQ